MCCCLNGIHVPPLDGWDLSASGLLLHVFCYVARVRGCSHVSVECGCPRRLRVCYCAHACRRACGPMCPLSPSAILDSGCSPEFFAPQRWFFFVLFKTKPPPTPFNFFTFLTSLLYSPFLASRSSEGPQNCCRIPSRRSTGGNRNPNLYCGLALPLFVPNSR